MKKSLILLITIVISFSFANAQTNVSGFINANTTWDLVGSPYIVIGNALVSTGYTLTINPGVVVKFDSAKALQIDGELIAIGTPQNRITFTSNQPIPQPGDWAKLHFADTCVNAVFDNYGNYLSGSIMKYCDVSYGGGLGFGEVHIVSSSPYINHCKILNSSSNGIHCENSTYLLDSSLVENCGGYGLYNNNNLNLSGINYSLIIKNDTIKDNSLGGIDFGTASTYSYAKIENNYFINNTNNGAINCRYSQLGHCLIANNLFLNNSSMMGILDFMGLFQDTIKCNKFINNHSSAGSCINCNYSQNTGTISFNTFLGNTGNYAVIFLSCNYANPDLHFSNNYISNNSSSSMGSCVFYAFTGNISVTDPFIFIDHNYFVNNIGPSTLYISGSGSSSNFNFLYFKYNSFSDPGVQYELDNATPYGSPNIYADSNYWGGTTTAHIDSVIHDYFDYANLSVVYYFPFLDSPLPIDTTCPPPIITGYQFQQTSPGIFIFPNPARDNITINTLEKSTIEILNIQCQILKTIKSSEISTKIDVGNLPSGIYLIKATSEKGVGVRKFLKD